MALNGEYLEIVFAQDSSAAKVNNGEPKKSNQVATCGGNE